MENHFIGDKEVSPMNVRKAKKVIHIQARAWCKVFRIGDANGSGNTGGVEGH